MTNTSKTIVFFGTDENSTIALRALIDSGFNVEAVVTKPDSKKGRGQKIIFSSVKKYAIEHNITVLQPSKVAEINDTIINFYPKATGVLVSYGKIIPQPTIELFEPGIINIHPSLLPKYRGPSPVEAAIKNGDKETGVSIMLISAGMDSGPILKQIKHPLSGHETGPELCKTLFEIGSKELVKILPDIISGNIKPIEQNEKDASYCSLLSKADAILSPKNLSAEQAERLVRAYADFPKTKTSILGYDTIITKAHVSNEKSLPTDILCGNGKYLAIDELVAPSGRKMSSKDFLNGYKKI